jgi:hypothetical protein
MLIDQPWKTMSIARRNWAVIGQSIDSGSGIDHDQSLT